MTRCFTFLLVTTAACAIAPQAGASPSSLIERGAYLATAGDCAACHSVPGGKPFAGGLEMQTPFGQISTPNITPDKETGIGGITDEQFYRVLHNGIGMKGEHLYPAMPFPWYSKVTRDDTAAIRAYLMSLPPVHAPRKPVHMEFPFNVRAGLIGWDALFLNSTPFTPDPHQSATWNRGAYLVQGLEHCGECHNGDNLAGNSSVAQRMHGGPIDQWYAPNISSDKAEGIGRYSSAQLTQYLQTGAAPGMGIAGGPMAQTIHESLSKLNPSDISAIVLYIKTTAPVQGYKKSNPGADSAGMASEGRVYLNYCAFCHGQNGEGLKGSVPPLAGNGSVASQGPQNVIQTVIGGMPAHGAYSAMPAMGARMTDQEVADAANYVRAAWGNGAPRDAQAGMVGDIRSTKFTLLAMNLPGGCPKIANSAMEKVIAEPQTQHILQTTTLENVLHNADELIAKVRVSDKTANQADIINNLTAAYCPVVAADKTLSTQAQKSERLDEFAERVYTELVSKGAD